MRVKNVAIVLLTLILMAFESPTKPTAYPFRKLVFFPPMPENKANPVSVEGALLGRYLFYDAILSDDNTMSCSSCHKQEFAFSDSPYALSKGKNGILMKRNTLPLFNLAWYPNFFWDGRASSIEAQVFHPLQSKEEMNSNWENTISKLKKNKLYPPLFQNAFPGKKIDSTTVTHAIAQFLRTLISNQSKYDGIISGSSHLSPDEVDGFVLINDQTKGDCLHCHSTDGNALGTSIGYSNNALDSSINLSDFADKGRGNVSHKMSDYGKFKIPSLRNIALTAPYMHDGRFKTLEEVLDFYSEGLKPSPTVDSKMEFLHRGGAHLTRDEKRKIIAFLCTLTDSAFIANPEFSNPFGKEK